MQFTHYIKLYVNCFGKTMLYMCIEYHVYVNMYDASTQGTDEHMIDIYIYTHMMMMIMITIIIIICH